jgi:uncharacterized membrane protein (DUF4010 family)
VALTGLGCGLGVKVLGPALIAVMALSVALFLAISYYVSIASDPKHDHGLTTEIAALATFGAAALSGAGEVLGAALIGVLLIVVLHAKDLLHGFIEKIKGFEIDAAVKLMVVAVLLLPILPDQGYGPGQVLNPRILLWAVVIIAGLGLAGYAALRIAGPKRGLLFLSATGALVSSTGVTVSVASLSKGASGNLNPYAAGIAIAQAVMFARTAILAAALAPAIFWSLWPALLAGGVGACAAAVWCWRRAGSGQSSAELKNTSPDTLVSAIQFVAVTAIVLVLAQLAVTKFGESGLIASGVIAGFVDVDSATVTASLLAGPGAATGTFYGAIMLAFAIAANSIAKAAICFRLGGRELGARVSALFAASVLPMLAVFAISALLT